MKVNIKLSISSDYDRSYTLIKQAHPYDMYIFLTIYNLLFYINNLAIKYNFQSFVFQIYKLIVFDEMKTVIVLKLTVQSNTKSLTTHIVFLFHQLILALT